jgi:hypothetical protein
MLFSYYGEEVFWFPKLSGRFHRDRSSVRILAVDSRIARIQFRKTRGDLSMLKKILLLAGAVLALVTAGSACIPMPPCFPGCVSVIDSSR